MAVAITIASLMATMHLIARAILATLQSVAFAHQLTIASQQMVDVAKHAHTPGQACRIVPAESTTY